MKLYISTLSFLLIVAISYSQKNINGAAIEESILKIEAKASSVLKVNITIVPTIDFDKEKVGMKFPIKFEVTPFNELTFTSKFKDYLKKLYIYQATTEKIKTLSESSDSLEEKDSSILADFIKNQFSEDELEDKFGKKDPSDNDIITKLKDSTKIDAIKEIVRDKLKNRINIFEKNFFDHLKNYSNQEVDTSYYKSKSVIDERARNLFRYFDAQLVLLFKYDTEPVAGTLFYKTEISNVQFFPDSGSEHYFHKRADNYHVIIKKLYKIINEDSNKNIPDNGNKSSNIIKEDTLIKKPIEKNSTNYSPIELKLHNEIKSHFKGKKEYKTKYIDNPELFIENFSHIIYNYKNYSLTERKEIITNKIISLKNEETYKELKKSITNYEQLLKGNNDSLIDEIKTKILDEIKTKILEDLQKVPLWDFRANDIQLDINDGFIEHIVITGEITGVSKQNGESESFNKKLREFIKNNTNWETNIGKQLKFTNIYPYGFSSTKDFEVLKKLKVYVYKGRNKQFEFELEAMFPNYVQTLQNDRLNFSPKDQVVKLPEPGKVEGSVELRKEKSSKLFNIVVYSDFVGLKEGEPNGVLQFELNKYIPLVTQKSSFFLFPYTRSNIGMFNYIEPQITWSRLDANNDKETLALSYIDTFNGNIQDSIPYVTQLNLLRYENISVGATLNLFTLDYSTAKIRFEINAGGKYGRTKIVDTKGREITTENIVKKYEINTWRFYPEFKLYLRPEERYGLDLNFRVIRNNSVSNDFSIISSEVQFLEDLTDLGQWLHQIEINAHFSPSGRKDDKFFFRYRYTNTTNWEYNGYSEIQVGYSMSLRI